MPEKAATSVWILRLNPMIHWSFKVLISSVFLGVLIVWGIDGWSVGYLHKDFVFPNIKNQTRTQENLGNFVSSVQSNPSSPEKFPLNVTHIHQNLTETQKNLSSTHNNLTETQKNLSSTHNNLTETQKILSSYDATTIPVLNLSKNQHNLTNVTSQLPPNGTNFSPQSSNLTSSVIPSYSDWISTELDPNYTSNLLAGWLAPGGEPCRESATVGISIPSFDGHEKITLSTGHVHEFVFQAVDESGKARCLGGDYLETDLSGERWKSRPPIKDLGNGTYSFSLQVHPDFPGDYDLTIILLFRHYEGLKFSPQRFVLDKELRKIPIEFRNSSSAQLPELATCKKSDFARDVWSGRWTRHAKNENCLIDHEGRFRCLEKNFPCQTPWCEGSLALVESNGWIYSTHCSFRLFSGEAAWNCLNGRWIFFWGDSNHCDTIRNILHFVLNVHSIQAVPRRFDMNVTNPENPEQVVRITSIFNGHYDDASNYLGLNSLRDDGYRELLKEYFSGERVPDTVVMNSGLHDGVYWPNIRRFSAGAEYAAAFWAEVIGSVKKRGVAAPEVVYRSTVATGGYARSLAFNPNKMEAFNGVFLEKLRRFGVADWVVDHFDMTYPWHYDNRCNDGVHYGRAPARAKWRDGRIGHQYFVDLMLGHVLLNALCAR